jgi:hypothetical protein
MRDEIGTEGQATTPGRDESGRSRVTRRGLIAKGAAVAAGGVGLAAVTAIPAEASTGTMMYGAGQNSGSDTTSLVSTNTFATLISIDQSTGVGLYAESSFGVGLFAHGGRSPILLDPHANKVGAPTTGSHEKGEVWVDVFGRHFLCIADGTPGTWVRPGLNPVAPYRVCDTRAGTGTPYSTGTRLGPGGTLLITIAGSLVPPAPSIPEGATAIVANLTVTGGTATSYLTAYPADLVTPPTASNINFSAGQTIANQVTVALSPDGDIKIRNFAGNVHVILDLAGFYF